MASCNPPVLLYTQVTQRSGLDKDTLQNLKETGECVVNIADADLLEQVNASSASLANDESEFTHVGIESCASHKVQALPVKASPVRYECTLREIKTIGDLPAGDTMVLLDVQAVYIRDELYQDGQISPELLGSVGKMGGDYYCFTSAYVALNRP